MWREVDQGFEFSGPKEAFQELRKRVRNAIKEGDRQGLDLRQLVVRMRDEAGETLFEGTFEEAVRLEIDGRVYLPKPL